MQKLNPSTSPDNSQKPILHFRKKFVNERKEQREMSFVVLYYCLFWGGATSFINDFDFRYNPIGVILYLVPWSIMIPRISKPLFSKSFNYIIICVFAWVGIHFLQDATFNYILNFSFILNIITGYFLCRYFGLSLFDKIVKIVTVLSAISIICWIIILLFGTSYFCQIAPFKSGWGDNGAGSFLLYHVIEDYDKDAQFIDIIRNSGFAWEPGRFASILVFVLTINLILHQQKKLFNISNIILILGIITTFSTTGYIALFSVLFLYLIWGSKMKLITKFAALILLIYASIQVYQMPFIKEKIETRSNEDHYISNQDRQFSKQLDEQITVDRFEGIVLDYVNFKHAKLLGYGLDKTNSFVCQNISSFIVTSNGITKPLAQYGFLFFIPITLLLIIGYKKIAQTFNFTNWWIFLVAYILVSFSYNFESDPLFRAICFFAVVLHIKKQNINCNAKKQIKY